MQNKQTKQKKIAICHFRSSSQHPIQR